MPLVGALRTHIEGLPSSDDPRAFLHPRAGAPTTLFENPELFRAREPLFGLDSVDLAAPVAEALIIDFILSADGSYAVRFAFFDCRQLLFFVK